jgi:hypothetical protein
MRSIILGAAGILAAIAKPAVANETAAQEPSPTTNLTLSSGIDYSSGKYSARETTDILVALTDITLQRDDFRFSVSLPYIDIKGPTSVIAGLNGVPVAIRRSLAPAIAANRSGWGDLNLGVTWSAPSEDLDDFQVDLTGRTKVATANAAKGLSSGETDFDFSVDVSREIGIWSPFVSFGYRIPGSPSAYSLNSAPSFSVGTSLQLDEKLLAIFSYDFDGTISDTLADSQQLFASVSWICNDSWTVTAYASTGLSSGAAQVGTGLLIGWKVL